MPADYSDVGLETTRPWGIQCGWFEDYTSLEITVRLVWRLYMSGEYSEVGLETMCLLVTLTVRLV